MPSPPPTSTVIANIPPTDHDDAEDDDDMEYEPATETTEDDSLDLENDYQDDEDEDDGEDDDDDDDDDEEEEDEEEEVSEEYLDAEETLAAEALFEELIGGSEETGDNGQAGGAETEIEIQLTTNEGEEQRQRGEQGTTAESQTAEPATGTTRPVAMTITRTELLQLLARSGAFRRFWRTPADLGNDEEEEDPRARRRRKRSMHPNAAPKIPSETGQALMESGTFGMNERVDGQYKRRKKLAARIMRRELGLDCPGRQRTYNRIASQGLIPSSNADTIIHYDHRCYSGQFSEDGNFFFSCDQEFKVRMYDTSNPYQWKHYRTLDYIGGQWTITDASLSPDNKFLAYSSIKSRVCLAHTDPDSEQEPYNLDFADMGRRQGGFNGYSQNHFGIFSIRFSGDGSEIVAGTSDNCVYVYDLETRRSILRIRGHEDDVNAVCYGDKSSPHILYSGSDDTTIKVWDRRSLSDQREAGAFIGHTEGLTYVDSKGDGRYVLSNGKDQSMKLWDLRKMMSTEKAARIDLSSYSTNFDYRFEDYGDEYRPHEHDCSVVTFRGHRVLKTLIRCHFSPQGSTDSRYVYTGSEDGSVYIYNMDATIAGKIDVEKATYNTRPRGMEDSNYMYFDGRGGQSWKTCVRDASWHPTAPVIAATSWNGYGMVRGTCTMHSWNDGLDEDEAEPGMGQRVDAELRADRRLYDRGAREEESEGRAGPRTRWSRRRRNFDDE